MIFMLGEKIWDMPGLSLVVLRSAYRKIDVSNKRSSTFFGGTPLIGLFNN